MKYLKGILLTTILCVLLSSCSSVMVTHDYDFSAPFSDYSQFILAEKDPQRLTDPRYDNELINGRFERVISERLAARGFRPSPAKQQADFVVSYTYSVRPKIDLYNISKQVGFSYGSYHRYGGVGARTCTDISEFDQGLLFVDVRDAQTEKLVWRGTATDIVSIHATPEKISEQVDEMVTAVLRNFPPDTN